MKRVRRYISAANRSNRNQRRRDSREITKNMVRCKSSNVWGYAFDLEPDADVGTLYVQFKNDKIGGPGDIYRYYNVPLPVYRKLVTTPSKGHYVWAKLRNKYKYSKLTGDKRGKLANAINH